MALRQPYPDAVLSFSDFLLDRFGLVASMQVAVVASIALHAAAIIGLAFKGPMIPHWDDPHNVLEVVLVNAKSKAKPAKADALAQANLDGGGNTDEKLRASTPFPNIDPRAQTRELQEAQSRMRQLEQEARELMVQMKSRTQVVQADVVAKSEAKPDTAAQDLVEKSLEIERLEAQIKRNMQTYQERPKRTFIGARAREYRFAQYVDNWRQKVERIGNLNYPEEAKSRRIYGSLQLTVAIKADGDVESVEVNRSSGFKLLDQAAIRIVRLAAPFERFPDNVRVDTDILHITRTWSFTRADQLTAE
jgi:periplasmic protein TonB